MIETVVTAREGVGASRTRLSGTLDIPGFYISGEGTYRYVDQTGNAPTAVIFQRSVTTVPAPCSISLANISVRKLELIP